MTSYGSGSGSDSFDITVTDVINSDLFNRDAAPTVSALLEDKKIVDYAVYAKHKGKVVMME